MAAMVFATACCVPVWAAQPAVSLCNEGESVVFSCEVGKAYASVCASQDLSPTQGYIQYRHGQPGHLDMEYPSVSSSRMAVFKAGSLIFSGGGGAWLRIVRNSFSYTIFTASGKWAKNGGIADAAGVVVKKNNRDIASKSCSGRPTSQLGSEFFRKAGIQESSDPDAFEIPDAFFPE
ncbi:hypothetical protein [Paraburkholderia sp. J63]|uniref:hypothetical protein n=1 Tax=Paraburkholderia sp. J63 TaxID=2805434 RepID=UPI002ABD186A|nr:hypothetical protein [Paraburkholderia sp. J63]